MIAVLLRPWRDPQTWWRLVHLMLGVVVGTASFIWVVVLLSLTVGLLVTFPLAVPCAWLLFVGARIIGQAERTRYAALLGVEIGDPVPPLSATSIWRRLLERVRSRPRWWEIGYGLLRLPLGLLTMVPTTVAWCGSAALLTLPLYVGLMPGGTAKFGLFEVSQGVGSAGAALVGLAGLVVAAPWITHGLARLDAAAGRWLLGLRPRDETEARVTQLETSRMAAVDSAEAERRRIERDLHDGAQQRLVSLAMDLGHARERLESDAEAARQPAAELVAEAHEEAKAALRELRDLVRGIHPAILDDRGLDAALSAVVARAPVPVRLDVDVAKRPPPAVESTAYFVVAEALTNVAQHAEATEAIVTIARAGDRLVVEVRDDGRGGADPEAGTGLRGLRDRVTAHRGSMHVVSPDGGPTTLLVEIPCAS